MIPKSRSSKRSAKARVRLLALFALAITPQILLGQDAAGVVALDSPADEFPVGFTQIRAIRELADGRILVIDASERIVVALNFEDGRYTQVGRHGSGPGEYLSPRRLLAVNGDRTWVTDPGNARILVLGPDGSYQSTLRLADVGGGPGPLPGMFSMAAQATDTVGGVYELASPILVTPRGTTLTDSSAIVRLDIRTEKKDTVGFVRAERDPTTNVVSGTAMVTSRPGAPRPLRASDEWAVSADGRTAVLTLSPYRVSFQLNGKRIVGPEIPVYAVRVSEEDKRNWLARRVSTPGSRTVTDGELTQARVDSRALPLAAEPEWPEYYPAFLPGAARFAPDGTLWVRRAGPISRPGLHDVIGKDGQVMYRVVIAPGSKLVGFGRHSIYLVREDSDGLQFLQRFPLGNRSAR